MGLLPKQKSYTAVAAGKGDPGYAATSVMLGEAALGIRQAGEQGIHGGTHAGRSTTGVVSDPSRSTASVTESPGWR